MTTARPSRRLRRRLSLALLAASAFLIWSFARPAPAFEAQIARFLRDEGIGGAVVAYGRIGGAPRLLALGEAEPGRPMRPEDRFHLASLAKPITAAAVLRLETEGRLGLEDLVPEAGRPGIAIRHLLQHSGGWDRLANFDPVSDPRRVAERLRPPYRCEDLMALAPPDEFAPGTRYAYSNLGYCALGMVAARVSGLAYEDYVARFILRPRGAEALAYDGAPTVAGSAEWPAHAYAALGPGGGWTGTAEAYWRFAAGPIDPRASEPPPYAQAGDPSYYGFGWRVWPDGALSHFGALPGAYSFAWRRGDRVAVFAFNGRPAHDERAVQRLRAALEALAP